jgi:hypothetical protein
MFIIVHHGSRSGIDGDYLFFWEFSLAAFSFARELSETIVGLSDFYAGSFPLRFFWCVCMNFRDISCVWCPARIVFFRGN